MPSMKSFMASLVSVGSIRKYSGTSNGSGLLVVVEQAIGDIERGDVVVLGLFGEGEDEFVAGAALGVGGLAADGFEALEQVVGGEGGELADALDHSLAVTYDLSPSRSANGLQRFQSQPNVLKRLDD